MLFSLFVNNWFTVNKYKTVIFAVTFSFSLFSDFGFAQNFDWSGGGADSNWSTDANWVGGVAPTGTAFIMTFGDSANLNPVNDISPITINLLRIQQPGYSISGAEIEFAGGTVTNPRRIEVPAGTTTLSNDLLVSSFARIEDGNGSGERTLIFSGDTTGSGDLFLRGVNVEANGFLNNDIIDVTGGFGGSSLQVDGTVGPDGLLRVSSGLSGTGTINREVRVSDGGLLDSEADLSSEGTLTLTQILDISDGPHQISSGTISVAGDTRLGFDAANGSLAIQLGATLAGAGNITMRTYQLRLAGGTIDAEKTIILMNNLNGPSSLIVPTGVATVLDSTITGSGTSGNSPGDFIVRLENNSVLTMNGDILQEPDPSNAALAFFIEGNGEPGNSTNLILNGDFTGGATFSTPMIGGAGTISISRNTELAYGANFGATHSLQLTARLSTSNQFDSGTNPPPVVNAATFILDGGELISQASDPDLTFNAVVICNGTTRFINGTGGISYFFNDLLNVESGALTVDGGQTVTGSGSLVIFDGASVNNLGTIVLPIVAQGVLDGGSGSDITSDVFLETATATGELNIAGTLTVRTDGESCIEDGSMVDVVEVTTVEEGELLVEENATLFGVGDVVAETGTSLTVNGSVEKNVTINEDALLEGDGEIVGDVDVLGTLAPGNSAGILDIDGCVVLTKISTTMIEIGGTMAGMQHDQINNSNGDMMTSPITLGGDLDVQRIDNFFPVDGDTFTIIKGFAPVGGFQNVVDGRVELDDGTSFAVDLVPGEIPGSQDVVLSDYSPGLGDINGDGNVDLLDVGPFVDLLTGGEFLDQADINRDGAVNLLDIAGFVELLIG